MSQLSPDPRADASRREIVLVAAVARNGVIGRDGQMAWHIPGEQLIFKAVTMGHPMIMGRRTYESIGRPLPGRRTIVVTRDPQWSAPGVQVASSLAAALDLAGPATVMIVGGGQLYAEAMPTADRLVITHLRQDYPGDTYFPDIDADRWQDVERETFEHYDVVTYRRRTPPSVREASSGRDSN